MSEWKEWKGTDEQIAEIRESKHGFILKDFKGQETDIHVEYCEYGLSDKYTHYLLCNPHTLADMIIRQSQTGQPVWVRYTLEWDRRSDTVESYVTTTPDWNIPNAEYSFTQFEDKS